MKIVILGAGNMGLWFTGELSADHEVFLFDINPERIRTAAGAAPLGNPAQISSIAPDLLLNAVGIRQTCQAFESALPYIPPQCISVDIASVKGDLPAYYNRRKIRFASLHPMFGPKAVGQTGPCGQNAVIIQESDPEGIRFFENFFSSRKIKVFLSSFENHDQMIAHSLSLPFVSSMIFASCLENTAVPGTTFRKHREIADVLMREDDDLLSEILFNPPSLIQLEKVTSRLEFLKHVLKARDYDEARRFFQRLRNNLM